MAEETKPAVHRDPQIMGGTFVGTRVPFQTLLDDPETGDPAFRVPRRFSDGESRTGRGRSRAGEGRPFRSCAFCLTSVCHDD